jgi:hypothetical protein
MSNETNGYYCLRCRQWVVCDPADEKNTEYLTARMSRGICLPCFEKEKKEVKRDAAN